MIRVTIDTFHRQTIVDVRQFYDDGNKMSPTCKRFSCSVRHLPAIAAAQNASVARGREMGLVSE